MVLILILLGLCYFFRKGKEKMGYEDHKNRSKNKVHQAPTLYDVVPKEEIS